MARLIEYEYRRIGGRTVTYRQWLVVDRADVKVLLLQQYEGRDVTVGQDVVLEEGAPILWFVFPGAWHDVGRFHLGDGTFTGWYANICTPVSMADHRWTSTDLFLDHWLPVEGSGVWLDEDELREAVESNLLDPVQQARVVEERSAIDALIAQGDWPPDPTREINLQDAIGMLDRGPS